MGFHSKPERVAATALRGRELRAEGMEEGAPSVDRRPVW